ncbi:MAG: GTPase, partial [Pseudomonadota bacterium]
LQRAAAMAMAGGAVSRKVEAWRKEVLRLSALIEAALDFSDEDDVLEVPLGFTDALGELRQDISKWLDRPRAEKLGEGFRVVLAGPPNAGKSTLFNALIESEAAITSPIAGTTRDVIEWSVAIEGVPFCFVDTAGLRSESGDAIEAIGIDRARDQLARADIVLWLGPEGEGPPGAWEIAAKADADDFIVKSSAIHSVSAENGAGIGDLKGSLLTHARSALPKPGEVALNARQHHHIEEVEQALRSANDHSDLLLIAEELRRARVAFDRLVGRATTEDMLDTLFGRFCIGK